jgi:predicted NBD/HSP70 family sugar kinase
MVDGHSLTHEEILAKCIKAGAMSYVASGSNAETRKQRRADRKAAKAAYAAQASDEFGITIKPKWIAIGAIGLLIVVAFGAPALILILLGWWFEKQLDREQEEPLQFDELCCSIAGAN